MMCLRFADVIASLGVRVTFNRDTDEINFDASQLTAIEALMTLFGRCELLF